ncbi:MAG: hypothetical protein WCJ30_17785 [Deltaproteobacteria bacterium]
MFTKRLPLMLAGALLLSPAFAHAQQADSRARSMIRQAMEDYQNLEIDGALNRLRLALNACGPRNCTPAMLARVHIAMGVVAVGGQNDAAAGTNEFAQALQLDPNAEPDAMLVTPEITAAFNQAHSRAGGTAGNTGRPGNTGGNTNPVVNTPRPRAAVSLLHTPIPEQLENTPVPVYVEPPAGLGATRYVVHFRGLGSTAWTDLPMTTLPTVSASRSRAARSSGLHLITTSPRRTTQAARSAMLPAQRRPRTSPWSARARSPRPRCPDACRPSAAVKTARPE